MGDKHEQGLRMGVQLRVWDTSNKKAPIQSADRVRKDESQQKASILREQKAVEKGGRKKTREPNGGK